MKVPMVPAAVAIALLTYVGCDRASQVPLESGDNANSRERIVATAVINPGDFRTYGQANWPAAPSGNNAAAYLLENFAAAFPSGLVVGDPFSSGAPQYTVTFTSAATVRASLPRSGTPGKINQSYVDPTKAEAKEAGSLLGHVVSLALNVGFDLWDPDFGASPIHFKDLVVADGIAAGMTVEQVLDNANKLLGKRERIYVSTSRFTVYQMVNILIAINGDFFNGTNVRGYLTLPPEPEVIAAGDFRTQTQGDWDAVPRGTNSAAYLHANFAAAFPNGLLVGGERIAIDGIQESTVLLTSAAAVQAMLPRGGTPWWLKGEYVDPTSGEATEAGSLLGQVVSLALNVGFDEYDPNYGASDVHLKDLIVTEGFCAGMTVGEVLELANKILGGFRGTHTTASGFRPLLGPNQINHSLYPINGCFRKGGEVRTYLRLP